MTVDAVARLVEQSVPAPVTTRPTAPPSASVTTAGERGWAGSGSVLSALPGAPDDKAAGLLPSVAPAPPVVPTAAFPSPTHEPVAVPGIPVSSGVGGYSSLSASGSEGSGAAVLRAVTALCAALWLLRLRSLTARPPCSRAVIPAIPPA